MGSRTETAQTISRHVRVLVRLARKNGNTNVINDLAIQEVATKLGLSGDDYAMRTVWIDIRKELALAAETHLLTPPVVEPVEAPVVEPVLADWEVDLAEWEADLGRYQGAGVDFEVRMELARQAVSIGYTQESAGRLMDAAYWVEESARCGDECDVHPGLRGDISVDGCEACEVVRQASVPSTPTCPVTLGAAYLRRMSGRRELVYVSAVESDRACLVKAWYRKPYSPESEIITSEHLAFMLKAGVLVPTSMGRTVDGSVIAVDLVRQPEGATSAAESAEVFYISGPGVHNRNSAHAIVGFVGECCEEKRVHLHLSARAAVISSSPQAPVIRHNVVMGDVVVVKGRPYRVCAVRHADPILVPVSYDAA